ncbi:protein EFFECTOR OF TRANSCRIPTION 2-like isoform X1 [Carex rostrata]
MEKEKYRRVKREECSRTKHDALFSPWKILVGPSDWDDHGKEGASRYRIHNLPENFPGLYELSIVKPGTKAGTKTRSDDLKDVVVVYLGQADNVRTRLQDYGRTGSHLECGKLDSLAKREHVPVKKEPGLFREVFARGFSIAFRCVPMTNKLEAEKREAQLLDNFDYAWNQIHNGSIRREESLSKLEKILSSSQMSSSIFQKCQNLKKSFHVKKVRVRINKSVIFDKYMVPEVRKVGRRIVETRKERLLNNNSLGCEIEQALVSVCGAVSEIDGSICKNPPAVGRKRCEVHKGRKINKSCRQVLQLETETSHTTTPIETICGIALGDGGVCANRPIQGRKRCEYHKGRRIVEARNERLLNNNSLGCEIEQALVSVCGAICEIDGSICKNPLAVGRKRCEVHKGRKINKSWPQILQLETETSHTTTPIETICGIALGDGGVCANRPIQGRKRCEYHKGRRIVEARKERLLNNNSLGCEIEQALVSFCGAICEIDGSICKNPPAVGRKRCEVHKGRKINKQILIPFYY